MKLTVKNFITKTVLYLILIPNFDESVFSDEKTLSVKKYFKIIQ